MNSGRSYSRSELKEMYDRGIKQSEKERRYSELFGFIVLAISAAMILAAVIAVLTETNTMSSGCS